MWTSDVFSQKTLSNKKMQLQKFLTPPTSLQCSTFYLFRWRWHFWLITSNVNGKADLSFFWTYLKSNIAYNDNWSIKRFLGYSSKFAGYFCCLIISRSFVQVPVIYKHSRHEILTWVFAQERLFMCLNKKSNYTQRDIGRHLTLIPLKCTA